GIGTTLPLCFTTKTSSKAKVPSRILLDTLRSLTSVVREKSTSSTLVSCSTLNVLSFSARTPSSVFSLTRKTFAARTKASTRPYSDKRRFRTQEAPHPREREISRKEANFRNV